MTAAAKVNPAPAEIVAAREAAGLTQTQASELVHSSLRAWQQWEAGDRAMHVGLWELFRLKVSVRKKGVHMTSNRETKSGDGRTGLTPEQRAAYSLSMEQGEAVFALEDMHPSAHDLAIKEAVMDGRVTPQQAHAELLAWVLEHKTVDGFIESRAWAL